MKHAVIYGTMDKAISNIFRHSFLLLIRWEEFGKIEVVDNWGFYGLPSTIREGFLSKLKIKMGLDVDITGNHGMLKHEEIRFLDYGDYLNGVTFELTEEAFENLQKRCINMQLEQEEAINEIVKSQSIAGKEATHTRIYSHEHLSKHIYVFEKIKAQQQERPSRLKPFEFNLSLTLWGPSLSKSHTCKSQLIELLTGILSPKQLLRLTEQNKHPTIPRFSGPMEKIFLHSTGPFLIHEKTSGEKVHYRDLSSPDIKLFMTIPPQEMEASESTVRLFKIQDHDKRVKQVVRKLQNIEWIIIDATIPEQYESYRKHLQQKIVDCYTSFSTVAPKSSPISVDGWMGYLYSIFSVPRDKDEQKLLEKLQSAQVLLNNLYMAIVDDWTIDSELPAEFELDTIEQGESETLPLFNPIEALASYLTIKDQKKLCKVLNRSFIPVEKSEVRAHSVGGSLHI